MTGRITPKLVRKAFKNVKRNRGAAGIDKVSISTETSASRTIPKCKGRLCSLGIPAVRDRIAQEVLRQFHIACLRAFVP
uniref:RNA-directed DNA polymerase n=1 Tax=Candidatus Kentrum sp. TC TaxID=2126339 RepID=A0A450Z585_9GAMM|nr:MAG: hypothetical protein BECKTC1821E_GA0114239_11353 [Candidatus Kentron sp. TC]